MRAIGVIFGFLLMLTGGGCVLAALQPGSGMGGLAIVGLIVAAGGISLTVFCLGLFKSGERMRDAPAPRNISRDEVRAHLDDVTRKHLEELKRDREGDGGRDA